MRRSAPRTSPPGGFGILDALLSLALVVSTAVAGYAIWSQIERGNRDTAMVQQVQAIQNAMGALFGQTITYNTSISTAVVARSGLVPGSTATTIQTPFGTPISISNNGAGTTGYALTLGAMPTSACIKVMNNLTEDPDLTGLTITADPNVIGYGGTLPTLTPSMVSFMCGAASASGTAEVSLAFQNPGAQSVQLTPMDGLNTLPTPVGKVEVTNIGSAGVGNYGSCDPIIFGATYCASNPYVSVTQAAPGGVEPSLEISSTSGTGSTTTVTLATVNVATPTALAVTAPADPNYNPVAYDNGENPNYTGDPPPLVFANYTATTTIMADPGNEFTSLNFNAFASSLVPPNNNATVTTMAVFAYDQNGDPAYMGNVTVMNGQVTSSTGAWINAAGTGYQSAPRAGLTALNLQMSLSTEAINLSDSASGATVAFTGNPQVQVTTSPIH